MDLRKEVEKFIEEDGFYDIDLGDGRVFTAADEANDDGSMDLIILKDGVEERIVDTWHDTTLGEAYSVEELLEIVKGC